jgi:hypothetical protein
MRITMAEFIERGQAIYGQENFFGVDNFVELAEQRWGVGYEKHGFMHQTDHQAALRVLHPDREPTWLEVQDSWVAGPANIWAARAKSDTGPDPSWTADQLRLYNLIKKWGPQKGQRIFDGKDPDPDAGTTVPPVEPPVTPDPQPAAGLSPAPQRAEELATLMRPVYEQFASTPPWFAQWVFPSWEKLWPALKPLVVEAVLSARRATARKQG